MKFFLILPGLPKMANGSQGSSWRSGAAQKAKWKIAVARELVGLAPSQPFDEANVTFIRGSSVEPDDDNLSIGFKPLRDALVKYGFVVDDKPKNLKAKYKWEKSPVRKGFVRIEFEGIK